MDVGLLGINILDLGLLKVDWINSGPRLILFSDFCFQNIGTKCVHSKIARTCYAILKILPRVELDKL